MDYTIHQIIQYYANSTLSFVDLFRGRAFPGIVDQGRHTSSSLGGFIIPIRGSANFSLNGHTYQMNRQTIVHAGPGMELLVEATGEEVWEYVVVHYTIPINERDLFIEFSNHFMLLIEDHISIVAIVKRLEEQYTAPTHFAKLQRKVTFMELIDEMIQCAKRQMLKDSIENIDEVITYIHEHYAVIDSISSVAEHFGFERRRFSYLFGRSIGMSPIRYLTEIRLKRAKELLRITVYPIAKVAELVGYPDHFYFSRTFKKNVGVSPTKYRKEQLNQPKF